jgi:hypothetical protein
MTNDFAADATSMTNGADTVSARSVVIEAQRGHLSFVILDPT